MASTVIRPIWTHGGWGVCRFCGVEVRHGAVATPYERNRKLFLCRNCAWRLRMNWDGYAERARGVLDDGMGPDDAA